MSSLFHHWQMIFLLCLILLLPSQGLMAAGRNLDSSANSSRQSNGNGTDIRNIQPENGTQKPGPVYRPPLRGAPMGRIAGGTRGPGDRIPFLCALVPEHVGLTVRPQPTLYWYVSEPAESPAFFTISEKGSALPLVEERLPDPDTAGVHAVRLSALDVSLQTGKTYTWFVALVPDAGNRSKDLLTRGGIKRIPRSKELVRSLQAKSEEEKALVYAGHGLWYDALHSLMEQVQASPRDASTVRQLEALLKEAHIPEIETMP